MRHNNDDLNMFFKQEYVMTYQDFKAIKLFQNENKAKKNNLKIKKRTRTSK